MENKENENFGLKSLSTGYYSGIRLDQSKKIQFKNFLKEEQLNRTIMENHTN